MRFSKTLVSLMTLSRTRSRQSLSEGEPWPLLTGGTQSWRACLAGAIKGGLSGLKVKVQGDSPEAGDEEWEVAGVPSRFLPRPRRRPCVHPCPQITLSPELFRL